VGLSTATVDGPGGAHCGQHRASRRSRDLFEPFRRLRDRTGGGGFGLGLALVASIATAHSLIAVVLLLHLFGPGAAIVALSAWAVGVARSRKFLAVHWPPDVAGGWLLATAIVPMCARIVLGEHRYARGRLVHLLGSRRCRLDRTEGEGRAVPAQHPGGGRGGEPGEQTEPEADGVQAAARPKICLRATCRHRHRTQNCCSRASAARRVRGYRAHAQTSATLLRTPTTANCRPGRSRAALAPVGDLGEPEGGVASPGSA
jgi:hypothetical protein